MIERLRPFGPKPGQSVRAWVGRVDRADRRIRDAAMWSRRRIGPLDRSGRDLTDPTGSVTVHSWSDNQSAEIAIQPMNQQQLVDNLNATMIAAAEAAAAEAAARASLLDYMTANQIGTIRAEFGQIQAVSTPVWEYRDGGVTKAAAEVTRAERVAKAAREFLKGCQSAARSAGGARAKLIDTKLTLRVVRGKVD